MQRTFADGTFADELLRTDFCGCDICGFTGFDNCSANIGFEVDDQIEWKLSQKLPELQYSLNIETKID